jgi:hypothetical protein
LIIRGKKCLTSFELMLTVALTMRWDHQRNQMQASRPIEGQTGLLPEEASINDYQHCQR